MSLNNKDGRGQLEEPGEEPGNQRKNNTKSGGGQPLSRGLWEEPA